MTVDENENYIMKHKRSFNIYIMIFGKIFENLTYIV